MFIRAEAPVMALVHGTSFRCRSTPIKWIHNAPSTRRDAASRADASKAGENGVDQGTGAQSAQDVGPESPTAVIIDEGMRKELCNWLDADGKYGAVKRELEAIPEGYDERGSFQYLTNKLGSDGVGKLAYAVSCAIQELANTSAPMPNQVDESGTSVPSSPPEGGGKSDDRDQQRATGYVRADRIWEPVNEREKALFTRKGSQARSRRRRNKANSGKRSSTINPIDPLVGTKGSGEGEGRHHQEGEDTPLKRSEQLYETILGTLGASRAREYVVCVKSGEQGPAELSDWLPLLDALVVEEAEFQGQEPMAEGHDALAQALPAFSEEICEALRWAIGRETPSADELEVGIESQDSFASAAQSCQSELLVDSPASLSWALNELGLERGAPVEELRPAFDARLREKSPSDAEGAQRAKEAYEELMKRSQVSSEGTCLLGPTFRQLGIGRRDFVPVGRVLSKPQTNSYGDDDEGEQSHDAEVGIALRALPKELLVRFKLLNERNPAA